MRHAAGQRGMGFVFHAFALGIGVLILSACSPVNQRAAPPTTARELLQSSALELDPSCATTESVQVSFTIEPNGETSNIQPSSGPACVQAALLSWVTSFRYTPLATRTPGSVEWMMVISRGPVDYRVE